MGLNAHAHGRFAPSSDGRFSPIEYLFLYWTWKQLCVMKNHWKFCYQLQEKLELERLRSEDSPRRLMITHTIESCWIPSQNKVEWYRSRSKATTCGTPSPCSRASDHLYKYGKTPSGTIDATERTRFSRPRPNDLEDIGQGQRSLYARHSLILLIICAKYGKNPSRTVDFFFSRSRPKNFKN